jgi:putative ABC transport system permease protein
MLKNYLRVALRNISRHKGYSLLVIFGLSLGMAIFLLAAVYARFNFGYERFHKNADRIHMVVQVLPSGNKGQKNSAVTPAPLLQAVTSEFPEIEEATRFSRVGKMIVRARDVNHYESNVFFVEHNFFSFFSFKMLKGDPLSALDEPNSIILSEDSALKYFGNEDPLGKTMTLDNKIEVKVTGIIENPPENTRILYDFLVPLEAAGNLYDWMDDWTVNSQSTFLRLREGIKPENLEEKFPGFIKKYYPDSPKSPNKLFLLPIVDFLRTAESLDLQSHLDYDPKFTISYFLIAMALVVLIVVGINFMNLSTSRSMYRAKEIGMRKVIGASRAQLIKQFLGESVITTILSIPLALLLFYLLRPAFHAYIESDISLSPWNYPWLCLFLLGGTALLGVLSGFYPALFLSSFTPTQVLKGTFKIGRKGTSLRKILVVSQFTLSILMIVFSLAVGRQVSYFTEMDHGFQRENVLTIALPPESLDKLELLKNDLALQPDILSVSSARNRPINWGTEGQVNLEGHDEKDAWTMNTYGIDYGFIELLGLQILQGRSFSREYEDTESFILNETAVRQLKWDSPLGKTLKLGGKNGQVIGVAKDFLFDNPHWGIKPTVLYLEEKEPGYLFVKTSGAPVARMIEDIKQKWQILVPGLPFTYSTLEDRFETAYRYVEQMAVVFGAFGALAIFISCLGLVAMAFYSVSRRTKEIGVRKVLGASMPGITRLLLIEFLKQVIVANMIAWPLTYFLLKKFLQFAWAYTPNISLTIFILAALVTLSTAVLSVIYQTVKASLINPAEALRYE